MNYTIKDIATIALTAALTVVVGYVLYMGSSFLPIPGHKFIIFAPFLGFMLFIPTYKIQKVGIISRVSAVFAALMAPITLFMSVAILMTGITTDLVTLLLFRNYKHMWKIITSIGFYPLAAILWASFVSNYFTGNAMYRLIGGWFPITTLSLLIYSLGVLGAYLSSQVVFGRVMKAVK